MEAEKLKQANGRTPDALEDSKMIHVRIESSTKLGFYSIKDPYS